MSEAREVYHSPEPLLRVELERSTKGVYSWSIRYEAATPHEVLTLLQQVDQILRATYSTQPSHWSES